MDHITTPNSQIYQVWTFYSADVTIYKPVCAVLACFAVNPNSRILGFKYPLLQIPGSFSQALSGASSPDISLTVPALVGSQTPPIAWATVPTALHLHYYQLDWSLKYLLKDRGLTAHAVLKSAGICSLHLLATLSTLLAVGASSFWCVSSCLNHYSSGSSGSHS